VFWFDGALRDTSIAPVDLTDRGLTLGDGIFDTSLAFKRQTFLRQAHLARLFASAELLSIPFDPSLAAQALDALADGIGNGVVRLTLTRGGGARGTALPQHPKPFLFGSASLLPAKAAFPRLTLASSTIRRNETSPASQLKALPYLDAILGVREANEKGADDALFENIAGHVACLSVANIFAVFGTTLVTPALGDGVLPGTIRAFVLERASSLGLTAQERSLKRAELLRADAIFATNSVRLVAPVQKLDGVSFSSADHKTVKNLQDMISEAIAAECAA
jgi:branched-chain amino acid aminotransferase